ncbi:Galectin [Entamoeba marina]
MLSDTSFTLSFTNQSKVYYATAALFETFDEEKENQSFRLRLVDADGKLDGLCVCVEPYSSNNLYLSSKIQPSIRFRLRDKRMECLIVNKDNTGKERLEALGEIYTGKSVENGKLVVINCPQHFQYKEESTGIFRIGTYVAPFKPMHFIGLVNEIPNVDVIPGTTYFRACLHQNYEHSTLFKLEQGEIGNKFHGINNQSPTAQTIFGDWWIKVINLNDKPEIVFCEEEEADEFCLSGGRLEVIHDGKIRCFIGLGERRDTESYFMTTFPLDLLTIKLEVKAITFIENEELTSIVI